MGQMISFYNLSISPYEVEKILDIKLENEINEHSTLYVKALLSEDIKDNYVKNCRQGSDISLYLENSDNDGVLFCGIVTDIEVRVANGSYYMELYAASYSCLLDVEKKSRTFQDKQKTYTSLVKEVMTGYDDAMIGDEASEGKALERLIVQYQETDWEFLKRLASHFNTGIVSEARSDKIRCYFGIAHHQSYSIDSYNYSVRRDMSKFLKYSQNGMEGVLEQDFVYYEVVSEKPSYIGDAVRFMNRTLYVCKVSAHMDKGVLLFDLTMTTLRGMSILFQTNHNIVGVSLNATIEEIQNDRVKVSVKIDEAANHSPGQKCFFPYSTIYSSKDGSGWYCMPEIGDAVRIYFPDGIEEHSYAISSVHEEVNEDMLAGGNQSTDSDKTGAGEYSGKRDNPSIKSLRNQNGKEIRLTPEGIYMLANGTTIMLTDEGGVSVVSDKNIEFKSEKNIIISAEQDVSIVGLDGVDLSCSETASIKLEDNVEVIGQEVKAN